MNKKFYPLTNSEIAKHLTDIAIAYEIKNKNRFRITSYQNAADTILTYPKSIFEIWKKDKTDLDNIPGIGSNIMEKLDFLFTNGKPHPALKKVFKGIHPSVFLFERIDGIGPKIAYKLTQHLKFPKDPAKSIDRLIFYAQKGKIKGIPSFGEKSEKLILENTLNYAGRKNRMALSTAQDIAQKIIIYLKSKFPSTEFVALGSLRRLSDTVGDIDIAGKGKNTKEIINHFINYPESIQTIVQGPKKASIRVENDVRIDIMIEPQEIFGSLLQHFTGSRQHNINLRKYALSLGYSLSEYGIKDTKTKKIHAFENEVDFYEFLKLCFIKPQDRLGKNEIEIAQKCYNKTRLSN
ncbi:MAG: nucleotidyltransferase domain-containing protein [Candidatus Shapirobacteria bacterium]|jgi:DNA polymerase (family 10)